MIFLAGSRSGSGFNEYGSETLVTVDAIAKIYVTKSSVKYRGNVEKLRHIQLQYAITSSVKFLTVKEGGGGHTKGKRKEN